MQTSNRDYPIENNINDMLHTLQKISVRLPVALEKENFNLNCDNITLLKDVSLKLTQITQKE